MFMFCDDWFYFLLDLLFIHYVSPIFSVVTITVRRGLTRLLSGVGVSLNVVAFNCPEKILTMSSTGRQRSKKWT